MYKRAGGATAPPVGGRLDTYAVPPSAYRYRDLSSLTRWLARALWLDIAVSVVTLIAKIAAAFIKPAAAAAGAITSLWFLTFFIAAILTLLWAYFATANVHKFGADISFDPPWAVGWLIIPVVNVWMSFVVIEEIWRASVDARHWRDHTAPWSMIYWWCAWVAASLGLVVLWMMGGVVGAVIYFGGHIAYAYLLVPVVRRIVELQQTQALTVSVA